MGIVWKAIVAMGSGACKHYIHSQGEQIALASACSKAECGECRGDRGAIACGPQILERSNLWLADRHVVDRARVGHRLLAAHLRTVFVHTHDHVGA